jgi:hypothetical protein
MISLVRRIRAARMPRAESGVTMSDGSFHGMHVAPLQARHVLVEWRPARPRCDRVRVRRHTCDCRATFYELCQAGGLYFVRRTHRQDGNVVVHESPWTTAMEGEELWQCLLLGEAR